MSDTFGNQDNTRDPIRETEATDKVNRATPVAQPQRTTASKFTSLDFDDDTLRTKEKLAGAVAAVMILGPLFFGWSGIGR